MGLLFGGQNATKNSALVAALDKSQAVIEFDMDGRIVTANRNFLDLLGYTLSEIQGQNHSMLVEPAYRNSNDYQEFWRQLRAGKFQRAQFKRIGKGGREVWIEASYNPLIGADGRPFRVIKYATDVTSRRTEYADLHGKVAAIEKSQAMIEFNLDGTIVTANQNFLDAMGYSLAEIKGRHHGMFVEPAYRDSPEYKMFWEKLRRGEFQAGQYKRLGKGGRVVWIEGAYNPIFDAHGKPYKVVKFANDITRQATMLSDLKKLIDVNFSEITQAVVQCDGETDAASGATSQASTNVQTVATSAEELAASIREIADSMTKSQAATNSAFDQVVAAGQSTQRLADAAEAMGGIVSLIQNIAGQINLLALNATIESARAGDAGKGFAVVATEVKNLANQAAKATGHISQEINGIQTISEEVVAALDGIRGSIDSVREFVTATASAVEEQSAVTRDMSSSMQTAASAVESISRNISGISSAIRMADAAVDKTKQAAEVLAK